MSTTVVTDKDLQGGVCNPSLFSFVERFFLCIIP